MKHFFAFFFLSMTLFSCKKDQKPPKLIVSVVYSNGQAVAEAEVRFYVNSARVDSLQKRVIDTLILANSDGRVEYSTARECYLDIEASEHVSSGLQAWADTSVHLEMDSVKNVRIRIKR